MIIDVRKLKANDNYAYYINEGGTITIYKMLGGLVITEIPRIIDGLPVTELGESAFSTWSFEKIIIPDTVTTIGKDCFLDCKELKAIVIPDSVINIEGNAFAGCEKLTNIEIPSSHPVFAFMRSGLFHKKEKKLIAYFGTDDYYAIPEGILVIGKNSFRNATISEIRIADSVQAIEEEAFYGCSNLADVYIPSGVKYIGDHAFEECNNLIDITFSEGLKEMGNEVFGFSDDVEEKIEHLNLKLPDSLERIGDNCITSYGEIESIYIGASLQYMGEDPLPFPKGENVIISSENKHVKCVDEMIICDNKLISCITDAGFGKDRPIIRIPSEVHEIGSNSLGILSGRLGAESIPNSVIRIENNACGNVFAKEIVIPDSVEEIGDESFSYCSLTERVHIGRAVSKIGKRAFPKAEIYIDSQNEFYKVFDNAIIEMASQKLVLCLDYEVTSYTIPDYVKEIGPYAFSRCGKLRKVVFNPYITTIPEGCFCYCHELEDVILTPNIEEIGDEAFCYCDKLRTLNLYNGLRKVGKSAFSICKNLRSISLPDSVLDIGESAFYSCESLISFKVPNSVKRLRLNSFRECKNLQTIEVHNDVCEIEYLGGIEDIGWYHYYKNEFKIEQDSPLEVFLKAHEIRYRFKEDDDWLS